MDKVYCSCGRDPGEAHKDYCQLLEPIGPKVGRTNPADIQIIPNPYCPEGVIMCHPKDSERMRAELDRLRVENEQFRETLRYYASLKWFVNDGEYIYKRAEAALSVRG